MGDLSHWDSAEAFSGEEAAALVLGLDPLDPQAELWKIKPVLARMAESFRISQSFVSMGATPDEFRSRRKSCPYGLVSILFELFPVQQTCPWPGDPYKIYELPNRLTGPDGEFPVQKFARTELHRWLSYAGLRSVYQFELCPAKSSEEVPVIATTIGTICPFGNHNTELLGWLSRAAIKFWSNYDPSDKATAPTNKQVIDWLVDQGVTNRTAQAMATILRADGLQTGRRE